MAFERSQATQSLRGEFTIVVNVGRKTESRAALVDEGTLSVEFGEMTQDNVSSKRSAVAALARRHGLPPNEVYDIVERVKKSVE